MPVVVIVGFRYNSRKVPLESSLTDIYIVYSYYRDMDYKVYIASDIVTPNVPADMASLYTSGTVDAEFEEFITKKFIPLRHLVTCKGELMDFFNKVEITEDRKLLFYYTGHGATNNIILPDDTKFPALELRRSIINLGNSQQYSGLDSIGSNIFIILDCCNPHGLYLPFTMSRDDYRYILVGNNYLLPKVILITSSDENNKSEANNSYSVFTRELFRILKDRKQIYSFEHIIDTLDTKMGVQRCLVRASEPSLMIPWVWVVSKYLDFDINDQFDVITVRRSINIKK